MGTFLWKSLLLWCKIGEEYIKAGKDERMIREGMTKMELTHFDEYGKALMVDVTGKNDTERAATAMGRISVSRAVYDAIEEGTVGKGDVLGVATTAGIMGAKRTSELIPMCHILPVTGCRVQFEMNPEECAVYCYCTVKVTGKTGVEMEALTGVSVALLTVYDMCKAIDKSMEIGEICLLRKSGGKSGDIQNRHAAKKPARTLADLDIL